MGGLRPSRVFINLLMSNLVTLTEYKEAEGIANPKEDLRLQTLIPSISQLVKTGGGRPPPVSRINPQYYATNVILTEG